MFFSLLIAAGAFGIIFGSFLNAALFRYNTGLPLWRAMQGRSRCMRCGHALYVLDLAPILSWVFLRGRCRYCHTRISMQYPLVELVSGVLSAGVIWRLAESFGCMTPAPLAHCSPFLLQITLLYAFWFFIWMTVLFLAVYDWRHLMLPLPALALLALLAFFSLFLPLPPFPTVSTASDMSLFLPFASPFSVSGLFPLSPLYSLFAPFDLWRFVAGPLLAFPFTFLSVVSRGRWMGWGDGILALPIGWMLGIWGGISAAMLAFWIGAITGVGIIMFQTLMRGAGRSVGMKTELPFGPFLALGAAIVFFMQFDLFTSLGWWG